jgi:hypothetical protein
MAYGLLPRLAPRELLCVPIKSISPSLQSLGFASSSSFPSRFSQACISSTIPIPAETCRCFATGQRPRLPAEYKLESQREKRQTSCTRFKMCVFCVNRGKTRFTESCKCRGRERNRNKSAEDYGRGGVQRVQPLEALAPSFFLKGLPAAATSKASVITPDLYHQHLLTSCLPVAPGKQR